MALNKLKTGVAWSSQVPEQNANLDEIEKRLEEGAKKVIFLSPPNGDIKDFVNSLPNGNTFYIITLGVTVTGLPVSAKGSFQYGIAQVMMRSSNLPFIILIGFMGDIATTSQKSGGEWVPWKVYSGVSE